jgi:hypothetical protein
MRRKWFTRVRESVYENATFMVAADLFPEMYHISEVQARAWRIISTSAPPLGAESDTILIRPTWRGNLDNSHLIRHALSRDS